MNDRKKIREEIPPKLINAPKNEGIAPEFQ
jgi:hypothetical protein